MKKDKLRVRAALGLLLLGLLLAGYALVSLLSSRLAAEKALQAWRQGAPQAGKRADKARQPPGSSFHNEERQAAAPCLEGMIGLLTFPDGEEVPLFSGTSAADLARGAGHLAGTPLPGQPGNCVLAGHRETFFRRLGRLQTGDRLRVETAGGVYAYTVAGSKIVEETDLTCLEQTGQPTLTLITCYPLAAGPTRERYVVTARLE